MHLNPFGYLQDTSRFLLSPSDPPWRTRTLLFIRRNRHQFQALTLPNPPHASFANVALNSPMKRQLVTMLMLSQQKMSYPLLVLHKCFGQSSLISLSSDWVVDISKVFDPIRTVTECHWSFLRCMCRCWTGISAVSLCLIQSLICLGFVACYDFGIFEVDSRFYFVWCCCKGL